MIKTQTTIPFTHLFSGASVTGPKVNQLGLVPPGRAGGESSLRAGKSGQQALKTALGPVQNATPTVKKNNKVNFDTSMAFNTQLTEGITSFQSSLGSTGSIFTLPSNASSANGSGSMFDFTKASEALKGSTFDYTTNLLGDTQTAKGSITQANNWGEATGAALETAGAAIGGGMGETIAGTGLVTSGITTAAAVGWTGIGLAPALAQIAAGVAQIGGGLSKGGGGQEKASQAQDYAPQVDAATQAAIDQMLATGANNQAMQGFYQGLYAQAFPALNGAELGVKGLNGLLAQIDPSANAGLLNASGGTSTPLATPAIDTSWNTPATPTPPTTPPTTASSNLPGGSSTTASTWPTTSPDQATAPTANSPEDSQSAMKQRFITAFEGQKGKGARATDLAQGLTAQPPTGFDIAALGSLAVEDASKIPPLNLAYEQFKAELAAQKNGANQPDAGLLPASTNPMAPAGGEGANGQAVAGNGAPNGQGSVANAPAGTAQAQPGQPAPQATSVASAPAVADASWGASAPPTANGLTIPGQPVAKALATPAPTATLGSFA
jgi:hypothetical protein